MSENQTNKKFRETLILKLQEFGKVFNEGRLDAVMDCFSAEAVYIQFDGKRYEGKTAIRNAFTPLFQGNYGDVRFHETELIVDEENATAVSSWLCHHTFPARKKTSFLVKLKSFFYRVIYGRQLGWEGLDIFHFSADGMIVSKMTYTRARLPKAIVNPLIPERSAV